MEFKGKEEFQDVIIQVMKYAAFIAIDNQAKFPQAVETVRDLMEIYSDKQFKKAISKDDTAISIKQIPGPTQQFKIAKHKFRELVKLFGRSGFVEAKRIEGVLDGKTLDRIAEFSKPESK